MIPPRKSQNHASASPTVLMMCCVAHHEHVASVGAHIGPTVGGVCFDGEDILRMLDLR